MEVEHLCRLLSGTQYRNKQQHWLLPTQNLQKSPIKDSPPLSELALSAHTMVGLTWYVICVIRSRAMILKVIVQMCATSYNYQNVNIYLSLNEQVGHCFGWYHTAELHVCNLVDRHIYSISLQYSSVH